MRVAQWGEVLTGQGVVGQTNSESGSACSVSQLPQMD